MEPNGCGTSLTLSRLTEPNSTCRGLGPKFPPLKSRTFEASVGEGAMQRARRTQPPRSLWAEDGRAGHLLSDLQAT